MRASFIRSYRSKKGNPTFVYSVKGTAEQLDAFKSAQGDFFREDDKTGAPLWFTTRFIGKSAELIITTSGNVVPDMSMFDAQASLAAQYGGNLGAELAKQAASMLTGNQPQENPTPSAEPQATEQDADDLEDV
jgi:hypothetical protein